MTASNTKQIISSQKSGIDLLAHSFQLTSSELFGNNRMIVIHHIGEEYRLSITSNGKLILTK